MSNVRNPKARGRKRRQEAIEYELERIINHRFNNNELEMFVVWTGYPDENSWEPISKLKKYARQAIANYLSLLPNDDEKEEIRAIGNNNFDVSASPSPPGSPLREENDDNQGGIFVVEKIRDSRIKNNTLEFCVSWAEHPGEDTWEIGQGLMETADKVVDKYLSSLPPKTRDAVRMKLIRVNFKNREQIEEEPGADPDVVEVEGDDADMIQIIEDRIENDGHNMELPDARRVQLPVPNRAVNHAPILENLPQIIQPVQLNHMAHVPVLVPHRAPRNVRFYDPPTERPSLNPNIISLSIRQAIKHPNENMFDEPRDIIRNGVTLLEVSRLFGTRWLPGDLVSLMVFHNMTKNLRREQWDRMMLRDSLFLSQFSSDASLNARKVLERKRTVLLRQNALNKELMVFPMLVDCHWILCCIINIQYACTPSVNQEMDRTKRCKVVVWNSFRDEDEPERETDANAKKIIFEFIEVMMGPASVDGKFDEGRVVFYNPKNFRLQEDKHSCGIYTIAFSKVLFENFDQFLETEDHSTIPWNTFRHRAQEHVDNASTPASRQSTFQEIISMDRNLEQLISFQQLVRMHRYIPIV